jgi:hypothetical protein
MTILRQRLLGLLIVALGVAAGRELEQARAVAMLEDMGYDDCPVCLRNRPAV